MDTLTFTYTSTDGDAVTLPAGGGTAGTGDIINGGQAGPIAIGSTNVADTKLIAGGSIHIGDNLINNTVYINGSLTFHHKLLNNAVVTETLDASHYFVEIISTTTTTIQLPAASVAAGRQYIIVNGKNTGALTIIPTGGDTIDGVTAHILKQNDWRVTLISNGGTKWLIV